MAGIYRLYKELEGEKIILSFKGAITGELLSSVSDVMEKRVDGDHGQRRRVKMFYYILVECLQNVVHHSEAGQEETKDSILMLGHGADDSYRVVTGNHILNANIGALKAKIERINGLSADELHAYYLDKLNTTELSQKGGAGLGLIEIARKSGHKIEYDFENISDDYSFFTLIATVK